MAGNYLYNETITVTDTATPLVPDGASGYTIGGGGSASVAFTAPGTLSMGGPEVVFGDKTPTSGTEVAHDFAYGVPYLIADTGGSVDVKCLFSGMNKV